MIDKTLTIEWLRGQVHVYSAPFSAVPVLCANGTWAVWPVLRCVDDIPPHLQAQTLRGAYLRYLVSITRKYKYGRKSILNT